MHERPPFTIRDALVHTLRPRTYEATALIYLDTARTAPGFDLGIATGELLQHDLIVLATSRPVLQQVCASPSVTCDAADQAAPENGLARRITASVYRGTSSIAVTAKAPTAAGAAALANAVVTAMIANDSAEVARLFKPSRD